MIILEPGNDVPLPERQYSRTPVHEMPNYVAAAAATAKHLKLDGVPNNEDKDTAARITLAYAQDPDETSKQVTPSRVSEMTPEALVLTSEILQKYGHSIVDNAVQLRHMVTNKLIDMTENPDPRVRLKALELLGKHSDVGLFSEKSEVTVTHQATDDLREALRGKLTKLAAGQVEEAVTLNGEAVDVDAELGIKNKETQGGQLSGPNTPSAKDVTPTEEEGPEDVSHKKPRKLRVVTADTTEMGDEVIPEEWAE